MDVLSRELKTRLEAVAPDVATERLERLSQWGTRVMATIVNLNNRLKAENPLQSFIRHIEEWFADQLGIPIKDHSLSPEEKTFLNLLPQITQNTDPAVAKNAVNSLFNLYDAEQS